MTGEEYLDEVSAPPVSILVEHRGGRDGAGGEQLAVSQQGAVVEIKSSELEVVSRMVAKVRSFAFTLPSANLNNNKMV